jgi:hypothetical protein
MINSFIDMVNESALNKDGLVDEMGVKRPERLTGSEMGAIRQSSIRRQQELANRPQRRSFNVVAGELETALKNIRRLEITMEKPANSRKYFPKFPEQIVSLMRELKEIDENRFLSNFGKWKDLYPNDTDSTIHFRTEAPSDFQRSHFPNGGIPPSLRGVGLGYKLYRTLLKYAGYISSNRSGTTEKDKAWGSMLEYKANPDGSPSEDDAHAIIGPSNWMALDKQTLSNSQKAEVAMNFITNVVGLSRTKEDRFDMDDELLELLPDEFLTRLDSTYLDKLVADDRLSAARRAAIDDARTEAQRLERERQQREETERRERQAREEAETRRRLASRIATFGADPEADWEIGDFIVVKQYLYQDGYAVPIRRVVARNGRTYVAVKVRDAIAIDQGTLTPEEANDTRTTSDKSSWVKVNIDQIPNLDNVNLQPDEKAYLRNFMDPDTVRRREEERAQSERERLERERQANADRAASEQTFGPLPSTAIELKRAVEARPNLANIETLKKMRTGDFVKFIVLAPQQVSQLRGYQGIPVFAAYEMDGRQRRPVNSVDALTENNPNLVLVNMVTGHTIQPPFAGLGMVAYTLEPVTEEDKLRARGGDHYYIANHQNNYGILAKCDYTTRNTANQPFIYMVTFGAGQRSTAVRLDLLRKIVGDPIQL